MVACKTVGVKTILLNVLYGNSECLWYIHDHNSGQFESQTTQNHTPREPILNSPTGCNVMISGIFVKSTI